MDIQRFKDLLDRQHDWPSPYTFKFVVERPHLDTLLALFPGETPSVRPSSKDRYLGVTYSLNMSDSESVVAVYERVRAVPGLMAL